MARREEGRAKAGKLSVLATPTPRKLQNGSSELTDEAGDVSLVDVQRRGVAEVEAELPAQHVARCVDDGVVREGVKESVRQAPRVLEILEDVLARARAEVDGGEGHALEHRRALPALVGVESLGAKLPPGLPEALDGPREGGGVGAPN
jgi:hypothetical protein